MVDRPPTSIVLPLTRWTPVCAELAAQLGPDDELLLVCDAASDPIATRSALPEGVRLVIAGEPEGCSGKANAVAAGVEAARHDRLVWTDDDFHHPPNWLEELHADYERHGPVTELPFFVGRDPLALLLEPLYAIGGTLGVYLGDRAWGGAVVFERADLDEERLLVDLRRTVSDDGLLSERADITPVNRARRVPIGGSFQETLERHVRFTQIVYRHEPRGTAVSTAIACLIAVGCLLFPIPALALLTLVAASVYATFGVHRLTALLVYPAALVHVPLTLYALGRRTFVWGGRRYRWRGKFDVTLEE